MILHGRYLPLARRAWLEAIAFEALFDTEVQTASNSEPQVCFTRHHLLGAPNVFLALDSFTAGILYLFQRCRAVCLLRRPRLAALQLEAACAGLGSLDDLLRCWRSSGRRPDR